MIKIGCFDFRLRWRVSILNTEIINHDDLCVGGEGKCMLGANAHLWRKIITCKTLETSQYGEVHQMDGQLDCFHFRLEVACPSLLSWPSAEISLISFRKKSAVYSLWEDPKVSVQLVDKRSSDGHFRIELDGSVCALLAIYALETEDWGGGLTFAFTLALKDPFGAWTVSSYTEWPQTSIFLNVNQGIHVICCSAPRTVCFSWDADNVQQRTGTVTLQGNDV